MSDPKILLFGCGNAGADPDRALSRIEQITLPAGERLVLSSGKFDARKRARTLNIEAGYPAAMIAFQNRFRHADDVDARLHFEDGFDILSISESMDRLAGFDFLLMMRSDIKQSIAWPDVTDQMRNRHFLLFDSEIGAAAVTPEARNILIDLRDPKKAFLLAMRDIYQTGAAFAVEPYSLATVLDLVSDAVEAIARSAGTR